MIDDGAYRRLLEMFAEHDARYRLIEHPPEGYVSFASADVAERLAGSAVGTILPFAFSSELELIVDPELRDTDELFFNAARLDRSVALHVGDYFAIAQPRIAAIAER